ncbi:hypothetical protein [Paenibacillus sp. LjRoot56]|uniref:hypothetical protein n=1 Tax=Paenibacillus sp. LjRoot56 TaxID=3342333 RepID=UPI003F50123D
MRTLPVLLLICGVILISGCLKEKIQTKAVSTFEAVSETIQKEKNTSTYEVTDETTSSTKVSNTTREVSVSAYGLQVNQTYTVQADIGARYDPNEVSGVGPVFEVNKGDTFRILAIQDEYVQVESKALSGWIPEFYFSKEAANIQIEPPYEMIVANEVPVSSAPGNKVKNLHLDLWAGKVVLIKKSYMDWVAVSIVQYDAEYGADMWVPKSSLQGYDPVKAKEGRLAPHSTIYDEHGQIKDEQWVNSVFIQSETQISRIGPVYQIISSGGQKGYIRVKDFIPNPSFH